MDAEIQFGEVEQPRREQRRRPDRDQHFAVIACQSPRDEDLPIFVDLDAYREMETHAASDTAVELGGVLLGGQYLDEDGRPFVFITDSLRAKHFEATKGSFKFTHDTWSEITRQRDEFNPDLRIVGWYHTHPGWSVFLSGLDLFICEHFFPGELDVALVIDPCQGDRGWFQWTSEEHERIRRTGGFFLVASRHRQADLEFLAAQLEGRLNMASDSRRGGSPAAFGSYPPPVIHIAEPSSQSQLQTIALLGLLSLQFFLVAVIAWRLLTPAAPIAANDSEKRVVELVERLDRTAAAESDAKAAEVQNAMLDRVLSKIGEGGPAALSSELQRQQLEIEKLRDDQRVYTSLEAKTKTENDQLQAALQSARDQERQLAGRLESVTEKLAKLEAAEQQHREDLAAIQEKLEAKESTTATDAVSIPKTWLWAGGTVLLAALIGISLFIAWTRRRVRAAEESAEISTGEPSSPPALSR